MPQFIYHVDEIARKERRGILYITFGLYQEPLKPSVFLWTISTLAGVAKTFSLVKK